MRYFCEIQKGKIGRLTGSVTIHFLHVKDAVNSDLKHRINTEVLIFVVSLELIGVCGVSAVVLTLFSGQELWSSWV